MSESNVKIKKIQKTSKTALILVRCAKALCIAVSVIALGCGFGFIGAQNYLDQELAKAIGTGELSVEDFYINDGGFLDGALNLTKVDSIAVTLGVYLTVLGIILICFSIVLHFMGKVFKDIMESYSPFRSEIIKSLKVVFVLITVLVLRSSLLIGAIVGFSLWCVFQIFEYGCELQKQSDETL
ncbi:MAG: hypothetical protein HDR20_11115 [Lachnospiraceae bacterium]|nr:hypothetical protein [Lachnospiraceae bacterium]